MRALGVRAAHAPRAQVSPASFVDLAVVARLFSYERTGMKAMSAHFGATVGKSKATQLRHVAAAPDGRGFAGS